MHLNITFRFLELWTLSMTVIASLFFGLLSLPIIFFDLVIYMSDDSILNTSRQTSHRLFYSQGGMRTENNQHLVCSSIIRTLIHGFKVFFSYMAYDACNHQHVRRQAVPLVMDASSRTTSIIVLSLIRLHLHFISAHTFT